MTFRQLSDACWADLPPVRRVVAGREACDTLLADAVRSWDSGEASAYASRGAGDVYASAMLDRVQMRRQERTGEDRYGFIWVFLLCAVASAIIQWLIKRWLDNHFKPEQVEAWQRELGT